MFLRFHWPRKSVETLLQGFIVSIGLSQWQLSVKEVQVNKNIISTILWDVRTTPPPTWNRISDSNMKTFQMSRTCRVIVWWMLSSRFTSHCERDRMHVLAFPETRNILGDQKFPSRNKSLDRAFGIISNRSLEAFNFFQHILNSAIMR